MPVDLAGAVLGWAVGKVGTQGVRWARRKVGGEDVERALRGVVGRATERAVEIAHMEERERLRLTLIEHQATGLDAASVISLRALISSWIEPLTKPVDALNGESYLSYQRIDPDRLVNVLEREIRDVIEADAVRGGPLWPVAERLRHDDQTGRIERISGAIGDLGERFDAVPEEPPPEAPPRQLPHEQPDFTGRVRELAALREQAAAERGTLVISAVSGTPGVGKSALALHAAHQLAGHYPDAQLFASLGGGDAASVDPGDVLGGFLRALGRRRVDIPARAEERAAQYRSLLAGRRALIVLDNATDEAQVRPLLPGSPICLVLVTSRRDLALDGAHTLVLDAMDDVEGGDLFARMVGGDRVAAEPDAAADVVRLCGGLPLAIRIAAARLHRRPQWQIAHLAERLSHERRRLAELRVGDLDVRASFAVSYEDLAPGEAALFRRLGVVPATEFDARLASALAAGGSEDAVLVLEALADAHLIEAAAQGRYRIHDLLRLFARERMEDEEGDDEASRARDTVARWYAEMVPAAVDAGIAGHSDGTGRDARFPDPHAALAWLDAEWEAAVAVAEYAATADDGDVVDNVLALRDHLLLRENFDAVERLSRHIYETAPRHGRAKAATLAAISLGAMARIRGDIEGALDWYDIGTRMAAEAEAHTATVMALANLVRLHRDRGDEAAARQVATRLEPLIEKVRGTGYAAIAANTLAVFQSDPRRTAKWLRRAYDLATEEDHPRQAVEAAYDLGVLAGAMGRREEARRQWAKAVEQARRDNLPTESRIRHKIATRCMEFGWHDEARGHFDAARTLHRQLGDHRLEAVALIELARAHAMERHFEDADRLFDDALALARELGDPRLEGWNLLLQAKCDELRGRPRRAEAHARDAYQLLRTVDEDAAKQAQVLRFRAGEAKQHTRRQAGRKRGGKKGR